VDGRFHELLRFGLVGAFNAGVFFGGYTGLVLLGVPYLLAAFMAFLVSASIGYWLHEHWTFQGASPTVRGWLSWLAAQGAATGLNLAGLAILVDGFGVGKIVAQAVLLPLTPLVTYVVGRRWVFSRA
jgi:putative flippase GtrA